MRQYLLIPVEKTSPYYPKDERPNSLPARAFSVAAGTEFDTQQTKFKALHKSKQNNQNNNNGCNTNSKSMESIVMSPEEENKKSIDEFLGKIDSTIAESRKYVAKSQHNSSEYVHFYLLLL